MTAYVDTSGVPDEPLLKMAKLGLVMDRWMKEVDVTISAVQCWTSMEEYFGVVPCTVMSMMSNANLPSACEVDVMGTISMHALTLASQTPAALLDWNNNYGDDPDKAVCFHCSNLPRDFFESPTMDYQEIIAGTVGRENTYGTIVGKVKAGPMSFARFSTDDRTGAIRGYVGEGQLHAGPAHDLRWRRRGGDRRAAAAAAAHLPQRLRAPRGRHVLARGRRGARSHHALSRLGRHEARLTMGIVAGVDFGTQSVRVSIVDSVRGVIGHGVSEYPVQRDRNDPDFATQSHDAHMSALVVAMQAALRDAAVPGSAVRALALDTTGSTVVMVGEGLEPLDDYYLWCDHRAKDEAARITAVAHERSVPAIDWCGGVYSSEWGFAKLLHWLRHNPGKRGQLVTALEHCDMVAAVLCGITDAAQVPRSICAMGHKWLWNESLGGFPPEEFFVAVDPLLAGVREKLDGPYRTSDAIAGTLCDAVGGALGPAQPAFRFRSAPSTRTGMRWVPAWPKATS